MIDQRTSGTVRGMRLVLGVGLALVWICGCSGSELARKDEELKGLAERWQRSEAARVTLTAEKARLAETLKDRESLLASAKQACEASNEALRKRTAEAAERATALKRLEEKTYDLEMSYETLSTRIKELKGEVEERTAALGKSKKVLGDLGEQMRANEQNYTKNLADQAGKTEEARAETARMRTLAENLDAEGQKLKAKNLQLEKDAVQIPDLKAHIGTLTGAKESLEGQVAKAAKDIQALERQVTSIQAAAKAAGTDIPMNVASLSDWEVLKRMGADRWERARRGTVAGDQVDILMGAVALTVAFLLIAWIGASVSALRRGRKVRWLRAAQTAAAAVPLEPIPLDEDLRLPAVGDEAAGMQSDAEDLQDAVPSSEGAAEASGVIEGWESECGSEALPEATEQMEPVFAQGEGEEEDVGSTQVITPPLRAQAKAGSAVRRSPAPSPAGAKPAKDDALIGELRDVINKKFDELLKQ